MSSLNVVKENICIIMCDYSFSTLNPNYWHLSSLRKHLGNNLVVALVRPSCFVLIEPFASYS